VVFNSVPTAGTVVGARSALINSVGKFTIPEGAIVDSVIAPAAGLEVKSGTFTRSYLVELPDGTRKMVPISLPIKILRMVPDGLEIADLKMQIDGQRISQMKIFPRNLEVTDKNPDPKTETSDKKYSLDDLRRAMAGDFVWDLNRHLLALIADPVKSAPEIQEQINAEVGRFLQAGTTSLPRSEVQAVPREPVILRAEMQAAMEKELAVVENPAAVSSVETKAPVGLPTAVGSVQTMRNEVMIRTEVLSATAARAEARMTAKIVEMMQDLDLQSYGDQTRFVVPYDQALIQSLIKDHPKAKVVIMAKSADEKALAEERTAGFAESTGVVFEYVISQDVQAIAKQQAKDLGLEVFANRPNRSVLQVRKIADAKITAAEINRAYALVGRMFGIVAIVGFEKSVDFATDHTIAEILQSEVRAAESIAQSA